MAALIAPGVCRFAINAQYGGHTVVNIVDMKIDTTGSTKSRPEACQAQAGVIINEWDDSMLELMTPQYVAMSVSWLDLDSEDGTVGVRTETDDTTWSAPGTSDGAGAPGNVALRINKNTTATRGQRQGRMYLAGFSEGWTSGGEVNQIHSGVPATINPALASFLGDINQDGSGGIPGDDYASEMVVVHTKDGVFSSSSVVDSLTVDLFSASQVRRIRR